MSELKSYINRVLGNSLRCLLPSYWWKRLFGLIVDELEDINDRIDAIDSGSGSDDDGNVITIYMPYNTEKNRLANIDAYNAIVAALQGGQSLTVQNLESLPSYILSYSVSAIVLVNDNVRYQVSLTGDNGNDIGVNIRELHADGTVEILGSVTVYEADAELSTTSEKPVQNKVVADRFNLLAPIMFLPMDRTEEAKAINAEAYRQYLETAGENRRVVIYAILGGGIINVVSSMGPVSNAPQSQYITLIWYDFGGGIRETRVYSDGSVTDVEIESDAVEVDTELSETSTNAVQNKVVTEAIEGLRFYLAPNGVSLSEEHKAINAASYNALTNDSVSLTKTINVFFVYENIVSRVPLYNWSCGSNGVTLIQADWDNGSIFNKIQYLVRSDGSFEYLGIQKPDADINQYSENPIQNKTVTAALKNKVDKVDGKQLSTEDFTSLLKAKLEGLSNYDDTSIRNAINSLTTQINTLVSGDASVAIESFNEIIAFLNGIEDSESLDSIIAAIEQQIAGCATTAILEQEIANVESQITGVASAIPTKISQLYNDNGFATEAYVNTQVRTAIISALNTEV